MSFLKHGSCVEVLDIFAPGKYKQAAINTPVGILDIGWLPTAAGLYKISEDPNNYVFAVTRIVTADLPNRNGDGFPYAELQRFDPLTGRNVYQTFVGKPTYEEHKQIFEEAKGAIFDARLIQEGPYILVQTICGFDRTKDADLADGVRTKRRPFFSMGAKVGTIKCSVCGKEAQSPRDFCSHISSSKNKIIDGKLCYEVCLETIFIEQSNVKSPADLRARHNGLELL